MTDQLLSEVEAAPLLRIKIKTLQTWRQLQKGPRFVRVGRRVFYPASEVQRYLASHLVETESTLDDDSAPSRVTEEHIAKRGRRTAA
jgi:hypothetical protein